MQRIWRKEGLRVPSKQPKRGRLWFADGSCIRKRQVYRNHVWSYDFVQDRTHDDRKIRVLTVIDEFTRECLAIKAARRLNSQAVANVLFKLFFHSFRMYYGPEFTSKFIRSWMKKIKVETLFITQVVRGKTVTMNHSTGPYATKSSIEWSFIHFRKRMF